MELMKYITASKNAINKAYQELERALMAYDEAMAKLHEKADMMSEQAVRDEHKVIEQTLETAITGARDDMNAEIAKQRDGFTAEVGAYYRADGSKLDQNDVAVLNAGFPLRDEELFDLIIKHKDNVTMLRQISTYIKQNRLVNRVPVRLMRACVRSEKGGSEEGKIFERFIHLAAMGFAHPDEQYTFYQASLDSYEEDAKLSLLKAKLYIDTDAQKEIDTLQNEIWQKNNDTRAKRVSTLGAAGADSI